MVMTNAEQLALARKSAAAANRRKKEERLARELEERGWVTLSPHREHGYIPPHVIEAATKLLDLAGYQVRPMGGIE